MTRQRPFETPIGFADRLLRDPVVGLVCFADRLLRNPVVGLGVAGLHIGCLRSPATESRGVSKAGGGRHE